MNLKKYIPGSTPWYEQVQAGLQARLGDGDALLLIPYDDGTFYLKPATYDKTLVGGIGGYETPDEDKFVVDGAGNAKRSLFGVPVALAIDPSEHAGVVEPIKALIAEKDNLGEYVRVDRSDAVAEVGSALNRIDASGEVNSQALREEMAKTGGDRHEALLNLAERGELSKYYDLTPKRRLSESEEGPEPPTLDPDPDTQPDTAADGGVSVDPPAAFTEDRADGYIVDQSSAAELLPKKWTSEKLQVMQDKARMEEHQEGKLMKYAGYGVAVGWILGILSMVAFGGMQALGGAVF